MEPRGGAPSVMEGPGQTCLSAPGSRPPRPTSNWTHTGAVDVVAEQKLVEEHDRIVLQFPPYWYSSPAPLKEWEDKVLAYGSCEAPTASRPSQWRLFRPERGTT
ncbi:hypothetical protein COO72_00505 [Bifidobacterium callitrichos]|nr:hypothetical protein COO72_00505 [Bifidobacterium callitrichos]